MNILFASAANVFDQYCWEQFFKSKFESGENYNVNQHARTGQMPYLHDASIEPRKQIQVDPGKISYKKMEHKKRAFTKAAPPKPQELDKIVHHMTCMSSKARKAQGNIC